MLTEMTPKRAEKRPHEEMDDEDDTEEVKGESDDEVEPIEKKPYFPDPDKPYKETRERIPNMREGAQMKTKKGKPKGNCYKCDEEGHFAKECDKEESLENNSKGNNSKRLSLDSQAIARKGRECFKCGEIGHMARDCVKEKEGSSLKRQSLDVQGAAGKKQKRDNFNRGKEGHIAKDCATKKDQKHKSNVNVGMEVKAVKTDESENVDNKFDYKNVDFKNFGRKNDGETGDFDPNKKGKGKKFGGGKQKQKFKNGGKSSTFNRN